MRLFHVVLPILLAAALITGCVSDSYERSIARSVASGPEDFLRKAVVGPQDDGTFVVATTQAIAPAGVSVAFPGRPTDLAVSPDGATLAVKTTGRASASAKNADIVFIDLASREIIQMLELPSGQNSFHSLVWSGDGQTLWTTDATNSLRSACRDAAGTMEWRDAVVLPGTSGKNPSAPGGLCLDEERNRVYVALSRNNTIGIVNLETKSLDAEIPVGIAPYTALQSDNKLYVSNWGGRRPAEGDKTGPTAGSQAVVDPETGIASTGTVSVIDLASGTVTTEIEMGLHPSGMALSPDGTRLYVANANSDTVSVIETATDTVAQTLGAKPMERLPFGSAPNALCVSPDGTTLYIANGGNNLLGVLDLASGKMRGLIPTGWYPGAVETTNDGNMICVANIKGLGTHNTEANIQRKEQMAGKGWHGYNSHDYMGSVNFIPTPDAEELQEHTYRAACNMRLPLMAEVMNLPRAERKAVPVPTRPGEVSVFKHVLYIIKENRTYDQVFGDMPQGNGDPSLCMFGREVTPNHHALAEEFVLLDNFYCNGVLSADGHQWTNEGYVTDYLEKSFGGWPRSYPYEGDDTLAFASSGFIWDHVLCKGHTFRDYGEFVRAQITPNEATWTDIYNDYLNGTNTVQIRATSPLHTLEPYLCPTYVGFPGKVQDVYRAREFIKELHAAEATGEWYDFMIMLLPNDHTTGTREGYPTPAAMVADNDLALGQIVEAVSNSPFWPETVIFVVEDDPQAGLDHVDSHRTVAFCISPYTRRGVVDSTQYNQTGMLRTMELIFGLAPMNQLTMASNPMTPCFQEAPDFTPYKARPNEIPLDQMNQNIAQLRGKARYYAKKCMELPLDDIDMADEGSFNRILWHAVKGVNTPYPKLKPRGTARVTS
ncbi:MAG: beta-propeller fold lactonase family protein [Candidatus Hydrogenedentes bacterium]|nr:beta-propeller fold lactonase family protein [Candidatus Hydrogenedentota bacterium]